MDSNYFNNHIGTRLDLAATISTPNSEDTYEPDKECKNVNSGTQTEEEMPEW